jgi:hypothetical protein
VAPQSVKVRAQLADDPLSGPIVQVHVCDRREVYLGAFDLADGCPKYLASFARGSVRRQLDDCVAHVFNVGGHL